MAESAPKHHMSFPQSEDRLVRWQDYPHLVRVKARLLGFVKISSPSSPIERFLGFCHTHQTYYHDLMHSDGCIRCPLCDQSFLATVLKGGELQ